MNFQGLKLSTKLVSAFVAVCLLGAIVSGVGIDNMRVLNDESDRPYDRGLTAISLVKEANIDLVYVARDRRGAILAESAAEKVPLR